MLYMHGACGATNIDGLANRGRDPMLSGCLVVTGGLASTCVATPSSSNFGRPFLARPQNQIMLMHFPGPHSDRVAVT